MGFRILWVEISGDVRDENGMVRLLFGKRQLTKNYKESWSVENIGLSSGLDFGFGVWVSLGKESKFCEVLDAEVKESKFRKVVLKLFSWGKDIGHQFVSLTINFLIFSSL